MPPDDPDLDALERKFRKELNAGAISLLLLALLASGGRAMYGYEIAKLLEERGGPPVKQGTLYPALRALERLELLASRTRPSAAGPPRRYYRITARGRRTLARWIGIWRGTRDLVDGLLESFPDERSRRGVSG